MPPLPVREYRDKEIAAISEVDTRIEKFDLLRQLTEANVDHSNTPYELKRKKKRRGRSI
jgi:hypothetical protein